MSQTLIDTYKRLPVEFARGEGAWLWDTQGRSYLDALAGVAVCSLGHSHPAITEVICEQARTLLHCSNHYEIGAQRLLADKLTSLSGMQNVFFSNSGAEANETAIKIARLYASRRKIKNPSIIVMEGAFHGRTLATLTASGNRKIQAGFEPLVQGFLRAPYGDLDSLETIAKNSAEVVAVLVEPVQGEGGVIVPDPQYLRDLRALCDRHGWLLILDEIQTGLCRTGQWFAYQHSGILPDVLTLAKSLGNGIPIGACLARGDAALALQPGNHGSTFGGNPFACRVALRVLETMEKLHLDTRAAQLGDRLRQALNNTLGALPGVKQIRGLGMMIGIELDRPCTELPRLALESGLLINVTADSVIRLLPPLILSDADAEQLVTRLTALVQQFLKH